MRHELKIWPVFFSEILDGSKTFEVRKHDRLFGLGDILCLKEYVLSSKSYTGREVCVRVTYIMTNATLPMIALGYCILGIQPIPVKSDGEANVVSEIRAIIRDLRNGVRNEPNSRKYQRIDKFGERSILPNV